MKTLLWIIGIILALPILLTIVALIVVTLIGGYITAILYWGSVSYTHLTLPTTPYV